MHQQCRTITLPTLLWAIKVANPLVYDIRDYQNALNRFRQAQAYNKRIDEYNKTLAFDKQGRTLVKEKFGDKVYAVTDDGTLEQTGFTRR